MIPRTTIASDETGTADDPAAHVAELFDACCGFVCRVLRHLGVHEAALDDAVQDVFVTAHRRWSSFEGRSSARSWLYGIARRIAFRYRRSADARARRFVASDERTPEGADQPLDRVQAAHSLAALLARIDADKRAVFLLVELEGMTAPEVADALGLPLGTVYSRLRAAWQGLGREADREARRELRALQGPEPSPEQRRRMWGLVAGGLLPSGREVGLASGSGWLAQAKWWVVGTALGAGLLGARAAAVASGRADAEAPVPTREHAERSGGVRARGAREAPVPSADPSASASASPTVPIPPETPPDGVAPAQGPSARASATTIVPAEPSQPGSPAAHPPRTPGARPSTHASPSTATPTPADDLAAELALLRHAQQALRDGRPAQALAQLDAHARRFPQGQLSDERDAARLTALCAAGRRTEAADHAQRLGRDPTTACP